MSTKAATSKGFAVSPHLLALRDTLQAKDKRVVATLSCGQLELSAVEASDGLWIVVRREGKGGLALRAGYTPGGCKAARVDADGEGAFRVRLTCAMGEHVVIVRARNFALESLRVTVRFTPAMAMRLPFIPRDLCPLDARDDPLGTDGRVEARQRGLNSGIVYFRLEEPAFGNVLYFQNLTALSDYFLATGTVPEDAVGGVWPELGYLPPVPAPAETEVPPLAAGKEVILSDALLVIRPEAPRQERESARQFLQMLGVAYGALDLPETEFRNWIDRAERTLRDLDQAPDATTEHYGHRYVHPYTAAEYPDIMVQMSVVTAIHEWGKWQGEPHALEADFKSGLRRFYDPKLKALRRYLPNVGDDKDADAVDSWYLYHPMLNLGILALQGDEDARTLLMEGLEYGIKAAHHFKYKWPVQYKVTDFSVIDDVAPADGRGQTDVGGVYAWVMLQAFELTDDKRYLDEARLAIDTAMGLRFNINYQANLTAWGAAACMRLWRITNRDVYLEQSYVYLASFFHNCEIWKSEIALAKHYSNFMGVTCLQDAPYMAMYECFDSFVAFERYLDDSGPDLEPAARMLIAEYCRYALYRAWFYYPDALPPEAIADTQREKNGHIDRKLSFPVEDLYPDGQKAGQVGQEIYGAGAAFIFATRAFHKVEGAPFLLYCDHFVRAMERTSEQTIAVTLDGGENCFAGVSLVRAKRRKLGKVRVATSGGDVMRPQLVGDDRIDFRVPANGRFILSWD